MVSEYVQVNCNGEVFRGEAKKLIGVFEAKGYQAERDNLCPHAFWQSAEYLKREKK